MRDAEKKQLFPENPCPPDHGLKNPTSDQRLNDLPPQRGKNLDPLPYLRPLPSPGRT